MERLRGYHFLDFSAKGEKNWVGLQLQLGRALYQDRSCEVLALQ
jgi:hypothetical protein